MAAELPKYLEVIFMDGKQQLIEKELDQEWVQLITEAKELGLTIEELKKFFKKQITP